MEIEGSYPIYTDYLIQVQKLLTLEMLTDQAQRVVLQVEALESMSA